MHIEQFPARGALTRDIAENLANSAAGYPGRIVISSNGHSVHLPVLPYCWDALHIQPGSTVTVTAESAGPGHDYADRLALRAVVAEFGQLTR